MNVAAMLALAVVAQQPQDTVNLKPVVVTATRVPVAADLVPAAVTVLRGSDLAARGIRSVADALKDVAGVHIVETGSYGGQTSLFVRGGESDYVKVLLDGVPLNDAGGGIDLANLTTDNVDRIEIVRGPVSVLYGSDAVTGVVQIFTKAGARLLGADVRAGTYGAAEEGVDVAGGARSVSYSARVSHFSDNGIYSYNNQYHNTVVSGQLRLGDSRGSATLTYRYGDDLYHFPTNSEGAPVDSNQRSAERGPLLSLSVDRALGSLTLQMTAGAKESRRFFNDEPDSPGEDGAFWSRDYLRRSSIGLLANWQPRTPLRVIGGVEYEDERQRGTSDFSASFGDFPDSILVGRHNTGYFGEAIAVAGAAAVTLGARLDDNSQFGTHATYRAGAVYRLPERVRLRLSAGTGFKEPTFFENFAHGFVVGNPNLDPERSQSWEVGVARGGLALTYFNQRFKDLVEYNPAPPPGAPNYFNVDGALADGLEASAAVTLSPRVSAAVRYTYLHTRVTQSGSSDPDGLFVPGKPLIRRPAQTLSPEIAAALGERLRLTLGARWVGRRDDLDFSRPVGQRRVTLRPYTRLNLAADYTLHPFVLTATLENAFNDQSQEIPGFRPLGRTIMIGARYAVGR